MGRLLGGRNRDALPGDDGCADAKGHRQTPDPTDVPGSFITFS